MARPGVRASAWLVALLLQQASGSAHFLRHESENATSGAKAWPWKKDTHGHDETARRMYDPEYRPPQAKAQPATHARPRAHVETATTPPRRATVAKHHADREAVERVTTRRSSGTESFGAAVARDPAALRPFSRQLGRAKAFGTTSRSAPKAVEPPQPKSKQQEAGPLRKSLKPAAVERLTSNRSNGTESFGSHVAQEAKEASSPIKRLTSNRSNGTESFGSHVAQEPKAPKPLPNSSKASTPVGRLTSNRSSGTESFGSYVAQEPKAPEPLSSSTKTSTPVKRLTSNRSNGTEPFGSHVAQEPKVAQTLSNSTRASLVPPQRKAAEAPKRNAAEAPKFSPKPWDAKSAESVLAGRRPRVHFLFLAVDKISNMEVWKTFFQDAPSSDFRAYVHCKTYACDASVARSFSALKTIPSVHSEYCTDLVSPMIQLLSHAIDADSDGAHPYDKFAFVSDSTLPAKSFSQIYSTLSERDGSDFCVFPAGEWADRMPGGDGQLELLPKHSQWLTLERAHAEKVVRLWREDHLEGLMRSFRMNWHSYQWNNNSYGDQRNFGCLDEFWFMGALYGTVKVREYDSKSVWLHDFTNGPLRVESDAAWQGTCDTFVNWQKHLHAGFNNPFEAFHNDLDHFSTPHSGDSARPGWWDRMTPNGLRAIKQSGFLFVRKFIDEPELKYGRAGQSFAEAFIDLVLK